MRFILIFFAAAVLAQPPAGSNIHPSEIAVANASSTGTTVNRLAKLTGAPATAIIAATSDTSGIVGVVTSGAGTTGTATIAVAGRVNCVFDGATTAGDYVQNGTDGACHSAGSTLPTSGQVLGRVLSTNGGGGTYAMILGGEGSGGASTSMPIKNNAGTTVGTATAAIQFKNGTGTTWTVTDETGGIISAAPNIDTTSLLTLTGEQTMTNKTIDDETAVKAIAAPSTPASGYAAVYVDSTTKLLSSKDDAGAVTTTMTANQKIGSFGGAFDGGGSAIATNKTVYTRVPYACTITGWSILADANITIDVLKIATGTTLPSASIAASALPALATGNAIKSTTLTDWTTAVAADDMIGFKATTPGTATWAQIIVYCNKS